MAVQLAHGSRSKTAAGSGESKRVESRSGYRYSYRPRRLDTRRGIMYLMVPKVRHDGDILFFITERKRSEATLIQVAQEAFVQGVSTRKKSLGIESLSRSHVSEMAKGLNEQVNTFRSPSLSRSSYPILWVNALYEKVRINGRIVNVAILAVCGMDEHGQRAILSIGLMLEGLEEVYLQLFQGLRARDLCTLGLAVSNARGELVSAKAFREQTSDVVRCISCEIFWHILPTRTKIPLPRISKLSG